jgi:hypothetical protein
VRDAFVHGMDMALLVSAGFAVVGIVVTMLFPPRQTVRPRRRPMQRWGLPQRSANGRNVEIRLGRGQVS